MATTQVLIRSWLEEAKKNGATHLLVVCDTFDHEDYPVEVKPGENVRLKYNEYQNMAMSKVMEVYNLSMDFDLQLLEHRAHNF